MGATDPTAMAAQHVRLPGLGDGFDDDDFVSGEMCCICGGGESGDWVTAGSGGDWR